MTVPTRGSIETLASGSLRVKVYAGIDPVTKKRLYLGETIPAGRDARALAERARIRLVNEVNERRNPRTSATVSQLLDRYLREARLARKTLSTYRGLVDRHVLPFIGGVKVGSVDADVLDSLYAELNRCRQHCDSRCRSHVCRPLSAPSIRHIHWILSGAFRRALRLRWITVNPMMLAEPPRRTPPSPKPPTPEQAFVLNEDENVMVAHAALSLATDRPNLWDAGLLKLGYKRTSPWKRAFGGAQCCDVAQHERSCDL